MPFQTTCLFLIFLDGVDPLPGNNWEPRAPATILPNSDGWRLKTMTWALKKGGIYHVGY